MLQAEQKKKKKLKTQLCLVVARTRHNGVTKHIPLALKTVDANFMIDSEDDVTVCYKLIAAVAPTVIAS